MKLRRVAEKKNIERRKKNNSPREFTRVHIRSFLFLRRTQELGLHFLMCIYFTKKRLNVKIYRGKVDEH